MGIAYGGGFRRDDVERKPCIAREMQFRLYTYPYRLQAAFPKVGRYFVYVFASDKMDSDGSENKIVRKLPKRKAVNTHCRGLPLDVLPDLCVFFDPLNYMKEVEQGLSTHPKGIKVF